MDFELKDNKTFRMEPGTPRIISNSVMSKKLALEFLAINTEARKKLFSRLPSNINELLNPKPRRKK